MCCEPYLESEYGADYISETPVKLLDRLLYGQREHIDEEVTLVQLLACRPCTASCAIHLFRLFLCIYCIQHDKIIVGAGVLLDYLFSMARLSSGC